MEKKEFDGIWNNIAKIEIGKMLASCPHRTEAKENNNDFKKTVHSRYECEREKFRKATGIKDDDYLDRHKVAALFYAAFVYNADGHSINVFDGKNKRLRGAEAAVTHETAFYIARGIIESIITNNTDIDPAYRRFITEKGIVEPRLICFGIKDSTSYKEEVLKQLIYAQNENKLSVAQLAVIFFSLENNTRFCYEQETKSQFVADIVKRGTERKKAFGAGPSQL